MVRPLAALALILLALILGLQLWRWSDVRAARAAWARLASAPSALPERFDAAMVADLPEPAARFFRFAIAPDAPLAAAAEIEMGGQISLGTKEAPAYQPMRATQILASPEGFVWRLSAGRGLMRFIGSDAMVDDRSWVRFWLLGLAPIVRAGGGADHLRAPFGRTVAEAAIWTPAALLPQADDVTWEAADADTARATVRRGNLTQTVDIRVDAEGRPLWVSIPRWTDANPDKTYRLQPFGGAVADFRDVGGYRLPFGVEGGNFFGSEDYFPFYKAEVQAIRMLPRGAE